MLYKNAVETCKSILQQRLRPGMTVIDATVGNGHDSLVIKDLIGDEGHLIGFDLDERAIEMTRKRLSDAGWHDFITLYPCSHSEMTKFVSSAVDAVVFNLGYLPGQSKVHITRSETTLMALEQSLALLPVGGFIVVVIYPGHDAGAEESKAITEWSSKLDQRKLHLFKLTYPNQINHPPYLLYIERRSL